MPKRKKTKELIVFSRNSYKGRLKGVLPAFLPNRCKDLSDEEHLFIADIEQAIKKLLTIMDKQQ
jgi:hypothetical protein